MFAKRQNCNKIILSYIYVDLKINNHQVVFEVILCFCNKKIENETLGMIPAFMSE